MVVDDSSEDMALTSMLLRKVAGVTQLLTFTDAEAAVEFLANLKPGAPEFPAALVLDVKMPGMTGLELLEWVRGHEIFNETPVIMWSSSDDPRDVERAAQLGADCYLGKYPPVPAVQEAMQGTLSFPQDGVAAFHRVRGNLFLGRNALPNFVQKTPPA